MPKKKPENELTDKEQFERFKKTARELGVDESGKSLEDAFGNIVKPSCRSDHAQQTSDEEEKKL